MKRSVKIFLISILYIGLLQTSQAQTRYHYDPLGRLVRVDYQDQNSVIYEYDRLGNRRRVEVVETSSAPDASSLGGQRIIFVPIGGISAIAIE